MTWKDILKQYNRSMREGTLKALNNLLDSLDEQLTTKEIDYRQDAYGSTGMADDYRTRYSALVDSVKALVRNMSRESFSEVIEGLEEIDKRAMRLYQKIMTKFIHFIPAFEALQKESNFKFEVLEHRDFITRTYNSNKKALAEYERNKGE